jgi:histidinol-phosphate aminotransferase
MSNKTTDIDLLVRLNVKELKPYSTARDECELKYAISLDANESPYNTGYNRYPDPHQKALKDAFVKKINLNSRTMNNRGQAPIDEQGELTTENIFAGNGSDEAIDLLIRVFCNPGVDNIVSISPTYGMYRVAASVNDIEYRDVRLNADFSLDSKAILNSCDSKSKIIFLCSPNNPTGNLLAREDILSLLDSFNGIVVIDEAYIDFSKNAGFASLIIRYNNLAVLRTMSKAGGMAAIRVGFLISSKLIVSYLNRIKYPYNISKVSQDIAIKSINENRREIVNQIISERERISALLKKTPSVKMVYPSDSNFLLVKFDNAKEIFKKLIENNIVVRYRGDEPGCDGMLRITIGKPAENDTLISVLTSGERSFASGYLEFTRVTKETRVNVRLFPEGAPASYFSTGIGFLDHMLDQIALHSGLVMEIEAVGDLEVDPHHTIEDVAIVLGEALSGLISLKTGYNRYGFVLPMDESRAEVLIDFGGRPYFVWEAGFKGDKVGDFPCEMFRHFFSTLSLSGKFTLHIKATGESDHHKAEAIFKAFARSLRIAMSNKISEYQVPSSKGII